MIEKLFNFFFDKVENNVVITIKKENREIKNVPLTNKKVNSTQQYLDLFPNLYEYVSDYPSVKVRKSSKQSHDSYLE